MRRNYLYDTKIQCFSYLSEDPSDSLIEMSK